MSLSGLRARVPSLPGREKLQLKADPSDCPHSLHSALQWIYALRLTVNQIAVELIEEWARPDNPSEMEGAPLGFELKSFPRTQPPPVVRQHPIRQHLSH